MIALFYFIIGKTLSFVLLFSRFGIRVRDTMCFPAIRYFLFFVLFERVLLSLIGQEINRNEVLSNLPDFDIPEEILQKRINILHSAPNLAISAEYCATCHKLIKELIRYRKSGANHDSMVVYLARLCITYKYQTTDVCKASAKLFAPTINYIIDNTPSITPERVCSIIGQGMGCVDPKAIKWYINLPPPKEKKEKKESKKVSKHNSKKSSLRILHLTDFHLDPLYKPGSDADCGKSLCCQEDSRTSTINNNYTALAGYWGDYHVCDMPMHSLDNVMQELRTNYNNFDLVYYTGDIISHRDWDVTKESNERTIKKLMQTFAENFKNVKVYPTLGNHEPYVVNQFSPKNVDSSVSMQWTFDLVYSEWARWLPADALDTVKQAGYYTVLVRPGFRIIALNSNVCFTYNFWLIYDDKDPYDELKWLVNVLERAEDNSEKVHIIGHVPTGTDQCHRQWLYNFNRIVQRFSSTIAAQFNGHTHVDEWRVYFNPNNPEQVTNVAFNGGSFTTFVGYNPNFRFYDIDGSSMDVLDYDEYTFNLTKANENKSKPEWYKLYSFKDAYGLSDLSRSSIANLVKRMKNDTSLMETYFRFSVRNSDYYLKVGCDDKCLKSLYCSIVSLEVDEVLKCERVIVH